MDSCEKIDNLIKLEEDLGYKLKPIEKILDKESLITKEL